MLNFQTYGDPAHPTLLIAHGLYGSGRNWGVIAKRLSDVRHVVAVDMRNHGRSFWSDDHTYPALATDLAQVAQYFGVPMEVLGHSMGGKAAMMLALHHPDLVTRLIVGDIAPVAYNHSQVQYIHAMRQVDLSNVSRRSDAQEQLANLGVDATLQAFFTQSLDVAESRWLYNLDALEANMADILSFPSSEKQTFNRPTLFLSGALSDYVTQDHRPTIRSLFPQARFAKLTGAGHWLHAEKPRAFEDAVRVFLQSQSL